jgi:hypothetical protein
MFDLAGGLQCSSRSENCLSGILIGIATTLVVRAIVWSGMEMVLAMLVGMAAGLVSHLLLGFMLALLVGMFETMVAGVADRDVRLHAVRHA